MQCIHPSIHPSSQSASLPPGLQCVHLAIQPSISSADRTAIVLFVFLSAPQKPTHSTHTAHPSLLKNCSARITQTSDDCGGALKVPCTIYHIASVCGFYWDAVTEADSHPTDAEQDRDGDGDADSETPTETKANRRR